MVFVLDRNNIYIIQNILHVKQKQHISFYRSFQITLFLSLHNDQFGQIKNFQSERYNINHI